MHASFNNEAFRLDVVAAPGLLRDRVLLFLRDPRSGLHRCGELQAEVGSRTVTVGMAEVHNLGEWVRYDTAYTELVALATGASATVRICDKEIVLGERELSGLRRFTLIALLRRSAVEGGQDLTMLRHSVSFSSSSVASALRVEPTEDGARVEVVVPGAESGAVTIGYPTADGRVVISMGSDEQADCPRVELISGPTVHVFERTDEGSYVGDLEDLVDAGMRLQLSFLQCGRRVRLGPSGAAELRRPLPEDSSLRAL